MMQIDFHELAEKELLDSRDYYDDLVFGLGNKFVFEIEHIIKLLQNSNFILLSFRNNRIFKRFLPGLRRNDRIVISQGL